MRRSTVVIVSALSTCLCVVGLVILLVYLEKTGAIDLFPGKDSVGSPGGGGGSQPSPSLPVGGGGGGSTAPGPSKAGLSPRQPSDYTLQNGVISIKFGTHHAGCISALTYRGKPVVPYLVGRGGSMQSACCFDVVNCEDRNPTQAGAEKDAGGPTTSSIWKELAVSDKEVYTRTQAAYYYVKNAMIASSGGGPHPSLAEGVVSDVHIAWRTTLGHHGNPNLIKIEVGYEVPTNKYQFAQFQIVVAFCVGNMCSFKQWNGSAWADGTATPGPGVPTAICSPDGSLCMAMHCTGSTGGHAGIVTSGMCLGAGTDPAYRGPMSLINSVVRYGAYPSAAPKLNAGNYNFTIIVAVGTLAEITAAWKLVR